MIACAAALATLDVMEEERLPQNAAERGAQFLAALRELAKNRPAIGDVRGLGLMIGTEFVKDPATREPDGATCEAVRAVCADEGLLLLSCGIHHNVIRWIPPLDVTAAEIDESLAIFRRALAKVGSAAGAAGI